MYSTPYGYNDRLFSKRVEPPRLKTVEELALAAVAERQRNMDLLLRLRDDLEHQLRRCNDAIKDLQVSLDAALQSSDKVINKGSDNGED